MQAMPEASAHAWTVKARTCEADVNPVICGYIRLPPVTFRVEPRRCSTAGVEGHWVDSGEILIALHGLATHCHRVE